MVPSGFLIGHNSPGGGNDKNAQTGKNRQYVVGFLIKPPAGTRDSIKSVYDRGITIGIFQKYPDYALFVVAADLKILDETLIFKDPDYGHLQPGGRYVHTVMSGRQGVTNASQKICYGISHGHNIVLTS
jgi:hypothetical protein